VNHLPPPTRSPAKFLTVNHVYCLLKLPQEIPDRRSIKFWLRRGARYLCFRVVGAKPSWSHGGVENHWFFAKNGLHTPTAGREEGLQREAVGLGCARERR